MKSLLQSRFVLISVAVCLLLQSGCGFASDALTAAGNAAGNLTGTAVATQRETQLR